MWLISIRDFCVRKIVVSELCTFFEENLGLIELDK